MASVAIEMLGLVSGVLGLTSFMLSIGESNITPPGVIKVAVGYADNCQAPAKGCGGNADPGGQFDQITTFDWDMNLAGQTFDVKFKAGTFTEIAIDSTGRDIGFLQMVAGDNGLCLAYAMTTSPSGSTHVMTGDWFDVCDLQAASHSAWSEWYYGNMELGSYDPPYNNSYYPRCGWMDADHTCGHQVAKFQANMSGINSNAGASSTTLCKPPNLWFSTDPVKWPNNDAPGATPQSNPPKEKRNKCTKRRNTKVYQELVRSDIWSHSARELCESQNSRGPDFISHVEGLHCDMSSRELTPLCTEDSKPHDHCFDVNEYEATGRIRRLGRRYGKKKYTKVVDWKHAELGSPGAANHYVRASQGGGLGTLDWHQV